MPVARRPGIALSDLQKRIIWHLRVYGPTSRSQIAEALGQSNATITRFSGELLSLGLIREDDQRPSTSRGRPMVPLSISGSGAYAAGAACHPGCLEVVLVDFAGNVLFADTTPFDSPEPRDFAAAVEDRLAVLVGRMGATQRRFLGLGIAVPGYLTGIDDQRSVVPHLRGWSDKPLHRFFEDALGLTTWVENDGTAAALAEYYQERIVSRTSTALIFFLGHGVGGGVIAERDLYRGEFGNAGEIGQLFRGDANRPSGIDLIETLRGAGIALDDLSDLEGLISSHGDLVGAWMDRVAPGLQRAIDSGTAWLDPGAVIISGILPSFILDGLVRRLTLNAVSQYSAPRPRLHVSVLGRSAVCVGAGLIPVHALTRRH